jgi:hypothetical protein
MKVAEGTWEERLSDDYSDWKRRIDLHDELSLRADPNPQRMIRCADSTAISVAIEVLEKNKDWLPTGIIEDSRGRQVDVIDSLIDPTTLGDLAHIHKSGRLFAFVQKIGSISDLIVLDHSMKLQFDSSDNSSRRLRVFVGSFGMLVLDDGNSRILATTDRSFG